MRRARGRLPAPRVLVAALGLLALGLALSGLCGCTAREPAADQEREERALVVFAASSLREAFTALGADFERAHPGVELTLHCAGSQELAAQLEQGARADVVALADTATMTALERGGRVGAPVVFAKNRLALAVSPAAAARVRSFAELPAAERVVLGAPEVPVGRYSDQALERADAVLGPGFAARVRARVVSRELNVKQVLAKVRMGEADAALVYQSDLTGKDDVLALPLPAELAPEVELPVATVLGAAHPTLARAWQELLLSVAGQLALERAGLLPRGSGA